MALLSSPNRSYICLRFWTTTNLQKTQKFPESALPKPLPMGFGGRGRRARQSSARNNSCVARFLGFSSLFLWGTAIIFPDFGSPVLWPSKVRVFLSFCNTRRNLYQVLLWFRLKDSFVFDTKGNHLCLNKKKLSEAEAPETGTVVHQHSRLVKDCWVVGISRFLQGRNLNTPDVMQTANHGSRKDIREVLPFQVWEFHLYLLVI